MYVVVFICKSLKAHGRLMAKYLNFTANLSLRSLYKLQLASQMRMFIVSNCRNLRGAGFLPVPLTLSCYLIKCNNYAKLCDQVRLKANRVANLSCCLLDASAQQNLNEIWFSSTHDPTTHRLLRCIHWDGIHDHKYLILRPNSFGFHYECVWV